jgi:hypothetical protein
MHVPASADPLSITQSDIASFRAITAVAKVTLERRALALVCRRAKDKVLIREPFRDWLASLLHRPYQLSFRQHQEYACSGMPPDRQSPEEQQNAASPHTS